MSGSLDDGESQLHENIISEMVSDLKEDIQLRNIEGYLLQFGMKIWLFS